MMTTTTTLATVTAMATAKVTETAKAMMVRIAAESWMAAESGMAAELGGGGYTDFSMCRRRIEQSGRSFRRRLLSSLSVVRC